MSIKDLFQKYLDGDKSFAEVIKSLTGIINPDHAVDLIAVINQLSRVELGLMDKDIFADLYKLNPIASDHDFLKFNKLLTMKDKLTPISLLVIEHLEKKYTVGPDEIKVMDKADSAWVDDIYKIFIKGA